MHETENMELGKKIILLLVVFLTVLGCGYGYGNIRRNPKKSHDSGGLSENSDRPVTLRIYQQYAVMDNGIVQLTLSIPEGHVTGIKYGGINNVLDPSQKVEARGYWDIFWQTEHSNGSDWLHMENFRIIREDENQVELSFATEWTGNTSATPLNMDKRFIMLRGSSGFYNYVILDRKGDWPAANISQIRVAYKPHMDKFCYIVISDDIQKVMPRQQDLKHSHSLEYREAILWTNYSDPKLKTQVEDKYQYAEDIKDQRVHGWISSDPAVGFWLITPSTEFYLTGPFKQELTSHMGPTSLIAFFGGHYVGEYLQISLRDGEPWTKVLGPYFVYLNQVSNNENPHKQLWDMAKKQMQEETEKWPYDFPSSEAYSKSDKRGSISGRLLIRDGNISTELTPASSAWVGLAAPGEEGSWQTKTKGYQFWTQADNEGNFLIKGILHGEYNLYAWVPGFIGDYKYNSNILIEPGNHINLVEIVYDPPRNGPTLWEIGIPDRSAAEFFVPQPRPNLINSAFLNNDNNKFRQYGLWDRYTDLYPDQDLIFTVGASDYRKDWFFAHVPRRINSMSYQPATWQVRFILNDVVNTYGSYTLRLALASASTAEVQVRFNNFDAWSRPPFRTKRIGWDNAIARHGIHGLYWLFSFDVPGYLLQNGMNTLYLTQPVAANPFCGIMYDYIRLEAPTS